MVRATRQTLPSALPDRPIRSAARVRNARAGGERWEASSKKGARTVPLARQGRPAYRISWTLRHRFTRSRTVADDSPAEAPSHSSPAIGGTDTERSIRSRSGPENFRANAARSGGGQRQIRLGWPWFPHGQGFVAATMRNRDGKRKTLAARAIRISPDSSGWRSASLASRRNSENSSRKRI